MAIDLDDAFFPALWSLAIEVGTRPEIFLAVWFGESGLDPHAKNAIGCIGLNQSCPKSHGGPGFPNEDAAAYENAPASEQLAWIAPQVRDARSLNGGAFRSAARYYQANFLPATLTSVTEPRDVVAARQGPYAVAYSANKILDANGDGAITLEDLGRFLEREIKLAGSKWGAVVARLYETPPGDSPWTAPALVLYEPGSPRLSGPGGAVIAGLGLVGLVGALRALLGRG